MDIVPLSLYSPSLISFNCNCCFECRGLGLFNQNFPQYFVFWCYLIFFSVSICLFLLFRNIIDCFIFALYSATVLHHGFPGDSVVKTLPWWLSGKECRRRGSHPWVRKITWRRKWQPTPVFLLRNPMDSGDWQALGHKRWTQLSDEKTNKNCYI